MRPPPAVPDLRNTPVPTPPAAPRPAKTPPAPRPRRRTPASQIRATQARQTSSPRVLVALAAHRRDNLGRTPPPSAGNVCAGELVGDSRWVARDGTVSNRRGRQSSGTMEGHFKSLDLRRTPSPPLEKFAPVSSWVTRGGWLPTAPFLIIVVVARRELWRACSRDAFFVFLFFIFFLG
ncbi:hypothetical protein TIFTF001_006447 [Ficus carica]|uniref:Uncharacterized protein n=1 Tax=Ficus carica TaxID=3494 RepID=A0AA87ZN11_FICCA|nr:hypothetical protein TIFTF001_006447 [Ficus carica]